jgi:hypothetical protein
MLISNHNKLLIVCLFVTVLYILRVEKYFKQKFTFTHSKPYSDFNGKGT